MKKKNKCAALVDETREPAPVEPTLLAENTKNLFLNISNNNFYFAFSTVMNCDFSTKIGLRSVLSFLRLKKTQFMACITQKRSAQTCSLVPFLSSWFGSTKSCGGGY